ncbi:hypothetical protein [Sphingobacterium sp.]|uniref:hypothetical protein n=1 Tax=Sphingobacterium sp. TaxID=341027 RepID=UPI00289E9D17|nr:hypothetical protein [Sphingobacterium sp.]
MKRQISSTLQTILLAATIIFASCSKNNDANQPTAGDGKVSVKIGGVSYTDNTEPKLKLSNSISYQSSASAQMTVVPFDEDLAVQAILTPVTENATAIASGLRASTKAAVGTPYSLDNGATYQIAAYDASGNYAGTSGVLNYTGGSANWDINLAAGNYTFVAVAVAPGQTFPSINFNQNLSAITFAANGADTDVLWQSQQTQVVAGQNTSLDLVLSHLFTQVEVSLESTSANVIGNITSITGGNVSPNYATATIKLADGTYTPGGQSTNRTISFTGSNLVWTSNPVLIITDGAAASGTVNFGNVTLSTNKSGTLDLSDLTLSKGVKYTLTLRLVPRSALDIPASPVYWGSANLMGAGTATGVESTQYLLGNVYNGGGSQGYCDAVVGTGWQTPSQSEIESLIALGTVRGTYAGQTGWFFGTSTVPTANFDNYMFLPDNSFVRSGSGNTETHIPTDALGVYWADRTVQGTSKPALIMTATQVYVMPIHQNNEVGIRCVRNK